MAANPTADGLLVKRCQCRQGSVFSGQLPYGDYYYLHALVVGEGVTGEYDEGPRSLPARHPAGVGTEVICDPTGAELIRWSTRRDEYEQLQDGALAQPTAGPSEAGADRGPGEPPGKRAVTGGCPRHLRLALNPAVRFQ